MPVRSGLSSLDPSSKTVAVRLPADLASAVKLACAQHGMTPSEFLRSLVSEWAYGKTQLTGPDEGYTEARSMATQLAHAALKDALAGLPGDHQAARTMLQGIRRKGTR